MMRCVSLFGRNGERASHSWPTCLTHCTLSRLLSFLSFFFTDPTKSTTMETRSKTTSPITLWHNAPPQADSAQSVGRTFGEADSNHATRRGCRRSWRHPRREGRRWSARGWQSACHPRDIPSAATSALSPRSRSPLALAPSYSRRSRNPIDLPSSLPSYPRIPLQLPCTLRSLSLSRSLYRGSHHRLWYRLAQLSLVRARQSLQHPNTAHHRLLHLHSHLHLPPLSLSSALPSRSSLFRRAVIQIAKRYFTLLWCSKLVMGRFLRLSLPPLIRMVHFFTERRNDCIHEKGLMMRTVKGDRLD